MGWKVGPEIDPDMYCNLIDDKVSVKFEGKMITVKQIVQGQFISIWEKINLDFHITLYKTKIINSRWIADLGVE